MKIRLLGAFNHDHLSIPAGTVLDLADRELGHRLVLLGVAEMAGPERAVIEPEETRLDASVEHVLVIPNEDIVAPVRRARGRPRKTAGTAPAESDAE